MRGKILLFLSWKFVKRKMMRLLAKLNERFVSNEARAFLKDQICYLHAEGTNKFTVGQNNFKNRAGR